MAELRCLSCCGIERDGEVASVLFGNLFSGREAENVGGFVFAAEVAVEALDRGVAGEHYVDLAGEPCQRACAVEEAVECWLREGGVRRTTWRVDSDHRERQVSRGS